MARGTKNYFRHHHSAFEDEKIQKAISLLGYEGYAYFFIILEMCAKQCENEFKNPITFHQQSIRNVLRKQSKSCNKVLTKLQESGLFVVTFRENLVEFSIPNLAKYMGQYESKYPLNHSNKRKEKERKEKEIKEKLSCAEVSIETQPQKVQVEQQEISTKETWDSYIKAYQKKYGTDPVRNKVVNSQMKQFVQRIGMKDSPSVVEFYVFHNDSFYSKNMHQVKHLLSDAEKLKTQWASGINITGTMANMIEKADYHKEQMKRLVGNG